MSGLQSGGTSGAADEQLFDVMKKELFTAVVGDILDEMGHRHQFLPPEIRPLNPKMVLLGRAMPVLEADVYSPPKKPFGLMFEALDDLTPREVYVVGGAPRRFAVWGEMMTTVAIARGASGVLADGYVRDTHGILKQNFPTFARGSYAQDQRYRGEVLAYRTEIEIGGVRIAPGDVVFGDIDGVLIIPRAVVNEAIQHALEKVRTESELRTALERGMSSVEAFRRFGVM